jgi:hypothetical protein
VIVGDFDAGSVPPSNHATTPHAAAGPSVVKARDDKMSPLRDRKDIVALDIGR